jgi:formylglycine-generating enzyme required for sulfatase activity
MCGQLAVDPFPFVEQASGDVKLGRCLPAVSGKRGDGDVYGWDNEYGTHCAKVERFYLSERLVSNSDYYQFVKANGYNNPKYWSEEGWKWVQFSKATFPRFWRYKGDSNTSYEPQLFTQRNVYAEVCWPC